MLPSVAAVARQHFVATVELDQGDFEVDPPGRDTPGVPASRAEAMFRGADAVMGDHGFAVFGLGVATVSSGVAVSGDTTSATAPTTATAPTSTGATGVPSPTTTVSPTSATGQTGAPGSVAGYDHRLAWVGIVWNAAPCPASSPRSRDGSGSESRYVAVVFDARTGHDALSYRSGTSACGAPSGPPTVFRPDELVSVAWHPVGPASTAVVVTLPPCGSYTGWTQVSTPGGGPGAVEVVARSPFDPRCGANSDRSEIVDDVVPLGNGQAQLAHAAMGPVDALRTLTGD